LDHCSFKDSSTAALHKHYPKAGLLESGKLRTGLPAEADFTFISSLGSEESEFFEPFPQKVARFFHGQFHL
jgi:hypothetical protein